ncbi:BREX-1 system adenine-specific DNA-methyltransferase PglX [Synechococcus sp. PCC 6312]|uniref:BREX-1 system adenine-specific DNA-methyltransferase PglX n=1 Tax=Synechococcus sp. (strain ATCC 27167 / PCC 6312) TaxID=195253 RepID=UPI00029F3E0D|nr:BREX-1 system adenine-specific DNA-methyltransferase PglX [Synechococcus sp. PCC 6312]AFY60113.1 hypothetical protein Syn6312_0906 [Synechococcus sp. PCC 6312]
MDQEIRNKLRNVVTKCRKLLEDSISQELEGKYNIFARKEKVTADPDAPMNHLMEEDRAARRDILDHFAHIKARGFKPKDALDQLIREIAFTHLNRLCAYKMMEAREVYVGGQKFREAVSRGVNSNGVKFYLAEHEEDERLFNTGHQDIAYRHFLDWLGGALSEEIGVLFNPNDPANRLYPRQKTLDEVLDLLNGGGIKTEETELREQWPQIWSQDETIGWVYQYFTPKELRDKARKESQAPRNSYELAFRNQFFTPRYVVEFLTDNTLGRIWYEMRKGDTTIKDQCRYMVRRPTEIFLKEGEQSPNNAAEGKDDLSQEELLKLPVHIPHRPKKDPRELKILDPACGSGHFLLYCFDLLLTIYEEAYSDPDLGPALKKDYPTLDALKRDVPRLILAYNLHGIDIDLRASQIAALALWLRCQRAYQEMGLKKDRPKITRSNFVCAEPMPGEEPMRKEFVDQLEPKVLGQVVEVVFDKMKLAGEAGSLLKIEEEIRDAVAAAKKQYVRETTQATDRKGQPLLFTQVAMDRITGKPDQPSLFDLSDITDNQFFEQAEGRVIEALRFYAEKAQNGQRLQRRLFTEDAVRGFSFVDLCRNRYDVVLMNPPFGECSQLTASILASYYPDWNTNLLCAFVARAWAITCGNGSVGVIYDRTAAIKSTYEDFRRCSLLPDNRLLAVADLGWGVLDANVEVTTAVLHRSTSDPSCFVDARAVGVEEKGGFIEQSLKSASDVPTSTWVRPKTFLHLPNAVLAYDFPEYLRRAFTAYSSLEKSGITAAQGHALKSEVHYRAFWEVSPLEPIGPNRRWIGAFKGGDYSPFFLKTHHIALYGRDGSLVPKSTANVLRNKSLHTLPGIAYGKRGEYLDSQVLLAGQIFTHEGHAFPNLGRHVAWAALCLMNSRLFQHGVNCYCGQHKHSGYVNLFPFAPALLKSGDELSHLAKRIYSLKEMWARGDETHFLFVAPHVMLCERTDSFAKSVNSIFNQLEAWDTEIQAADARIEEIVSDAYKVTDSDVRELVARTANRPVDRTAYDTSIRSLKEMGMRLSLEMTSYCVGIVYGRWDVRFAIGSKVACVPEPFGELPQHPLATLLEVNEVGTGGDYPIAVCTSGILVDDPESDNDIVTAIQRCLDVLFDKGSENALEEMTQRLGTDSLRDYLRKAPTGGFWQAHVDTYSQSSRKAPIYWLLQSSKKNYAIWLYYHRLDKDLLFKALVNYVEPKIRLETSRLESLQSQKAAAGDSGKEAKRLAKEVEKQEDFLSELQDFEDKLRRAANLHLEPDLNDGVVLNIAPLHELVPWKEAKKYWDELMAGKYEWSSIGKQLREKGLVEG